VALARRFLVAGQVQGVGFRYFAETTAIGLGLRGFVRNLRDGRVEAVAEGAPDAVAAFEQALRQGPAHARVDRLEVDVIELTGYSAFAVERTR
jgi:acylphosphatase